LTGTVAGTKSTERFRILLLGFDDDYYFSSLPTFRDIFDSERFERVDDVASIDTEGPAIYSVVVNARFVGFSVEEFMKPLREKLPGEHIVVYAYGALAFGLVKRFYRSGADVVYANVKTEEDYRSLRDAVRQRYGYKTEAMRKAMACGDSETDLRYYELTSKLRLYVWYTVQGYSVKEIADMMHVTAATVTMMRKKALRLLGLRHSSQLIREGTLWGYGLK
jgi:DNA-binding NarL/FixJ family response regulator